MPKIQVKDMKQRKLMEKRLRIENMDRNLRECVKLQTLDKFSHEIPVATNVVTYRNGIDNMMVVKLIKAVIVFDEQTEAIDEDTELFCRIEMVGYDDLFDINMNKKEIANHMVNHPDRLHRINRILLTTKEFCEVLAIRDEFDPTEPEDHFALQHDPTYEPFKIFLDKFENVNMFSQQGIIVVSTLIYMKVLLYNVRSK